VWASSSSANGKQRKDDQIKDAITSVAAAATNPPLPLPQPPQPIKGSVGSRLQVILGKNGFNWLLLLNEDNGNMEWQMQDWKSIPHTMEKQIKKCVKKGHYVKEVNFGPTGGWYIHGMK